jgi:hypothetical protein
MNQRLCFFAAMLCAVGVRAQVVDDFKPPRGNCCLPGTAQTLADQLQDWNQLGRYHAADEELMKQPTPSPISGSWRTSSRASRM